MDSLAASAGPGSRGVVPRPAGRRLATSARPLAGTAASRAAAAATSPAAWPCRRPLAPAAEHWSCRVGSASAGLARRRLLPPCHAASPPKDPATAPAPPDLFPADAAAEGRALHDILARVRAAVLAPAASHAPGVERTVSGTGVHLGLPVAWQIRSRVDGAFTEDVTHPELSLSWGYDGKGDVWEVRPGCPLSLLIARESYPTPKRFLV